MSLEALEGIRLVCEYGRFEVIVTRERSFYAILK